MLAQMILFISTKTIIKDNKTRIYFYHKKKGFLVTNKDNRGRPNIFNDVQKIKM